VRPFRLLLWLRWRLAMNLTTGRRRWLTMALVALFALALAPLYLGAAAGAYVLGAREGASALLLVFGAAQAVMFWVSLLAGALGRTFELDKLKRYPFRPLDVFVFNTLASLAEPVALMTLPSLVAVVLGVAQHDGALAGLAAAAGALALLFITAAALQLLLAVLDDFLRREWMRYVAALLFTATILVMNFTLGRSSRRIADLLEKSGLTPERLLAELRSLCEQVPTVAAPAALGGAPVAGPLGAPLLAFAASAVMLALPVWLGARIMSRAVLRERLAGSVGRRTGRTTNASFARHWPGLTPPQALLLAREWAYIVRTPSVLYQLATTPLVMAVLTAARRDRPSGHEAVVLAALLSSALASRNLMLWSHDGPGIRSLFLLPFQPRDLVLSKNLAWLATMLALIVVSLGVLFALRPARPPGDLPLVFLGFWAVAFAAAAIGTRVSVSQPMKAREGGFSRQGPGGALGFVAYLAVLALGGVVVLGVLAVRALTPDAHDTLASLLVTGAMLAISVGVWWISLDRNAEQLVLARERMIDVIAKTADA
jgi:hypothetical protein